MNDRHYTLGLIKGELDAYYSGIKNSNETIFSIEMLLDEYKNKLARRERQRKQLAELVADTERKRSVDEA